MSEQSLATGADIHRDGRRLLVRTYGQVIEWRLVDDQPFEDVIGIEGTSVPRGLEIQGEAVAYDPISGGYMHVAEGSHPILYRIRCAP